jgi:hypothetical protein
MKGRSPSDLPMNEKVAIERANLVMQIADLEAKLALLKTSWPISINARQTAVAGLFSVSSQSVALSEEDRQFSKP